MDEKLNDIANYPILDTGAPRVAVVFGHHADTRPAKESARIYIWGDDSWECVFEAPYTRGVQRAGRGGRGHVYRLVRDDGPIAELTYRSPELIITIAGETRTLFQNEE